MRTLVLDPGTLLLPLFIFVLTILNDRHLVDSTPAASIILKNVTNGSSRSMPLPNRTTFQRAVEKSRKFACKDPQPRAYNLRDLTQTSLDLEHPGESANQPIYVVLKRCDPHSGCCMNADMICTPVNQSMYYEDIEIEVWNFVTNETRRQWIRIEQHDKCSCEIMNFGDRDNNDLEKRPNVILL